MAVHTAHSRRAQNCSVNSDQRCLTILDTFRFALSPLTDGWVAFIGLPTYEGAPGLPYDLWLLDTKSGRLLRLGKNANRDGIYDPRWSPDGTQIVFQMFGQGIWTLGLADGNLRQVYPGELKVYHYDMAILGRAQ